MKRPFLKTLTTVLFAAALPLASMAQVPVDEDGNLIGEYEATDDYGGQEAVATGNEGIPLLNPTELEDLVGPIALYPDDLLAVVLPAATYPLQVVQAARFLEDIEDNPSLTPNPEWDDSIIALINYPEVVELLNDDLDWTWQLGEAVVAQQADVVSAVERFRNRAYAAGNLRSDDYQTVTEEEGIIEITPVSEEVIYVPYYEPARVVRYQPQRVYYYYPDPCPVYYYPYGSNYAFNRGYFWGLTTAFSIGWRYNHLSVFHHSYRGHPYYGRHYRDYYWYRRPNISVHNNIYINNGYGVSTHRYVRGDRWRPTRNTRLRYSDQRITRNVGYPVSEPRRTRSTGRSNDRGYVGQGNQRNRSYTDRTARNNGGVTTNRTPRATLQPDDKRRVRATQPVTPADRRQRTDRNISRSDADRDKQRVQPRQPVRTAQDRRRIQQGSATRQSPARATPRTVQPSNRSTVQRRSQTQRNTASDSRRYSPPRAVRSQPQRSQVQRTQPRRTAPATVQRPARSQPQRAQPQRAQPQRSQPQRSAPSRRSESRASAPRQERRSAPARSNSREERRPRR